ncbi:MAG: ABC transporter ATP-binding protein [Pseudomonadota bacterium]
MSRYSDFFAGLIDPEMPADGAPPQKLGAFFRWSLSGVWGVIFLTALANMLGGAMEVITYYLLGRLVDGVIGTEFSGFWTSHGSLFLWFVVISIVLRPLAFGLASSMNAITLGPNLPNLVLSRIHRHVLGHSVQYFDDDFAGRISQKELQVSRAITSVVQECIHALIFALTMVIGTTAVFGALSPVLILLLFVWFALYFGFLGVILPRMRERSKIRASARAGVSGQLVDTVANMRMVKLFASSQQEDRAALDAMESYRGTAIHWARLAVVFRVGLIFLGGLLPVVMLGYGLRLWQSGAATAGDLAAIGALSLRLGQMSGWVSWTLMTIFSDLGEAEDGMRTLAPPHDLVDRDDAVDLEIARADLRFTNVDFQYGKDVGGVKGINLHIKEGEKIGLVGPSGAGKSTLMSLALRLYDPEAGRVEISDQNLAGVTQESLRKQIAMVTQDAAMFNRSAFDNIQYGRWEATAAEVAAAAKRAEADAFIGTLIDPKGRSGYDAYLGERGVKLSGGQRQRIALARAILKDAPILLLDEATSALDSEVEAQIQSALANVMEGKTVIAIAHRLSTIAKMDRIVVLDQGRIVEEGSHQKLLDRGGLYAKLWAHQSGGFLNVDQLKAG